MKFGVEKLVLKNDKMTAFIVSNPQSTYYQSDVFGRLLQFIAGNPRKCQLREQNMRRSVVFSDVKTVEKAWEIFQRI